MKLSCGVIIINEHNEILLCHVTGQRFYDIPKGKIDDGETPTECAIRECFEETGIVFSKDNLKDLHLHDYNSSKNLHLFRTDVKKESLILNDLKCSTFFTDKKSGKRRPEVDGYEWKKLTDVGLYCVLNLVNVIKELIPEAYVSSVYTMDEL